MAVENPLHHAAGVMLLVALAYVPLRSSTMLRPGVQVRARSREVSSAVVMVTARARKKAAGEAGGGDERQKDDDGSDGGSDERLGNFSQRLAHGLGARLSVVAMHHDVLDHDDGIVDDQADGRGQAAQGHQVEAFAEERQAPGW